MSWEETAATMTTLRMVGAASQDEESAAEGYLLLCFDQVSLLVRAAEVEAVVALQSAEQRLGKAMTFNGRTIPIHCLDANLQPGPASAARRYVAVTRDSQQWGLACDSARMLRRAEVKLWPAPVLFGVQAIAEYRGRRYAPLCTLHALALKMRVGGNHG